MKAPEAKMRSGTRTTLTRAGGSETAAANVPCRRRSRAEFAPIVTKRVEIGRSHPAPVRRVTRRLAGHLHLPITQGPLHWTPQSPQLCLSAFVLTHLPP